MCTKFQGDQIMCLCFIAIFAECAKRRKIKTKKKNQNLAVHISEMAVEISFKFGMWTPLAGRQLCSKCGFNRIRYHRDTKV